MKINTQKFLINVLGCLIFLSIPILTSPDFNEGWKLIHIKPFQKYFIRYCLLIVLFYSNYFYLIPKFYFNKRKTIFLFSCLVSFMALLYIPNFIIPDDFFPQPANTSFPFPIKRNNSFLFLDAQILISYLLILSFALLIKVNRNLTVVKTERYKSEISYLKAQINPHFLFNTLNSLYALTLIKSDEAPQAILKLSSLMRYVVTESSQDFVSLSKEINYINDYIELQKLRMNKEVKFFYSFTGETNEKKIAPLILIPFIENVFKYGLNPDKESQIKIELVVTDTNIILATKNKMVVAAISVDLKTETGLENTKKRLNFIYPNKHTLKIEENDNLYVLNLNINLT